MSEQKRDGEVVEDKQKGEETPRVYAMLRCRGSKNHFALWYGTTLPRCGDVIHISDGLPSKDRGFYDVHEIVWKPVLRRNPEGTCPIADARFLFIIVEKQE